jgi:hypothetical protein
LELKPNIEFNKKDISRYDVSEIKTPINDCPF